jgi:hypothetical protein
MARRHGKQTSPKSLLFSRLETSELERLIPDANGMTVVLGVTIASPVSRLSHLRLQSINHSTLRGGLSRDQSNPQ